MELHGAEGDDERLLALMEQVKTKNKEMVQSLSTEEVRDLLLKYSAKEPGAFSDIMYKVQHRNDPPPSAGLPAAPWCTCGNCKDMPTDQERICCGQEPCITRVPRFTLYCLSGGHLRLQRQQRGDYKPATEPGEDNREFRNAAYSNYIRWQSGSLDGGKKQVAVPSCVVWAVTDEFPSVPDH